MEDRKTVHAYGERALKNCNSKDEWARLSRRLFNQERSSSMKKIIFIFGVIILIGAGYVHFTSPSTASGNQYRFVPIDRGDIESIVSSTGTLSAITTVTVGTQVSGIVWKIFTDYNQRVKKGQIIALIDTTVLAANVRDAESTLEKTQAALHEAERNFTRTKALFERQLAATSDVDQALSAYELAKADVKSAEVSLDRAEVNLNYATIRAPLDGTVIDRKCDVGQTVAASFSTPELFLIANDLSKMQILANVDESDIGQIKVGLPTRFTVQAYPEKKFMGIVHEIRLQPTTIQNVVNYTVVVNVPNDNGLLLPGMTATIDFLLDQKHNVLRVPNVALRFRPTPKMIEQVEKQLEARAQQIPDSLKQNSMQAGKIIQGKNASQAYGFRAAAPANGNQFGIPGQNRSVDRVRLWYVDETGNLNVTPVQIGITDGQMTEIKSENVKAGMEVISSVTLQNASSFNPFQPQAPSAQNRGSRFGF